VLRWRQFRRQDDDRRIAQKAGWIRPKANVVVYHEIEGDLKLFEITDVSLSKGNPQRDEHTRKAGFSFDKDGLAEWLFISVDEA
jgi:hypothetical protein